MGSGRGMGADILLNENIVLVTINYRLGPFGFLSLGSASREYSGNMGLKDQLLALKWIHANIRAFGGNPELVTMYGHSAGAASVHMHILSSVSRPYFKRAIMSGASAFVPWAYGRVNHTQMMVQAMQAKANGAATTDDIVAWLQNIDGHAFGMDNTREFFVGGQRRKSIDFTWLPVVEGRCCSLRQINQFAHFRFSLSFDSQMKMPLSHFSPNQCTNTLRQRLRRITSIR